MPDDPNPNPAPTPNPAPDPQLNDKKFTQAELDAIISDRLDRERKKADADRAEAERKAAEQALEKNSEFERLANERKTRVDELEPKVITLEQQHAAEKARADEAEKTLQDYLKAELEQVKLPDSVKELLEGKSTVEKLTWLTKNKKDLVKGNGGLPASPGEDGKTKLTDAEKEALTAKTW